MNVKDFSLNDLSSYYNTGLKNHDRLIKEHNFKIKRMKNRGVNFYMKFSLHNPLLRSLKSLKLFRSEYIKRGGTRKLKPLPRKPVVPSSVKLKK